MYRKRHLASSARGFLCFCLIAQIGVQEVQDVQKVQDVQDVQKVQEVQKVQKVQIRPIRGRIRLSRGQGFIFVLWPADTGFPQVIQNLLLSL